MSNSDTMNLESYLAQGGVLTAPGNVPARYRGELMRLMSSFVDSELAASAGFAGLDQLCARHQGAHRGKPHHVGEGRPRRARAQHHERRSEPTRTGIRRSMTGREG